MIRTRQVPRYLEPRRLRTFELVSPPATQVPTFLCVWTLVSQLAGANQGKHSGSVPTMRVIVVSMLVLLTASVARCQDLEDILSNLPDELGGADFGGLIDSILTRKCCAGHPRYHAFGSPQRAN